MCEKIGLETGAILVLVGTVSSSADNPVTVRIAEQTLDNLEICDQNVRQMAENGRLKPLLSRLQEGVYSMARVILNIVYFKVYSMGIVCAL